MLGIAGLPIPDETLLVFYGYLISTHRLDPALVFVTAVSGSISGITLSYVIGRTAGFLFIFRYGKYVFITPAAIDRVHNWFARLGRFLLTIGYFILGVRHLTALVAGMSKLEFPIFAIYAYPGAVVWSALFLAVGYYVGEDWRPAVAFIHRSLAYFSALAVLIAIAVWLFYTSGRSKRT